MSSPDAITSVVATFKQRDQWSRKTARDPHVKLMHRHVLRSLALFAHTDSGGTLVFDPTYDELAKAARCHKRTAQRAVAVAEEIGIVRKARHSDGRVSNAYELLLPQAVSNGDKFSVPTVTNSDADEGPNGDKLSIPTVTNLPVAEGSNGGTAAAVLRVESKEERKKLEETVLKPTTTESADRRALNDRPIPEPRAREPLAPVPREPLTPVPRADARTEPVTAQQSKPSRNNPIGTPADGARAAFADVSYAWPSDRTDDDGYAAYVAALAAAQGDTEIVLDAIWERLEESGADPPWLSDALRRIEHDLRYGKPRGG